MRGVGLPEILTLLPVKGSEFSSRKPLISWVSYKEKPQKYVKL